MIFSPPAHLFLVFQLVANKIKQEILCFCVEADQMSLLFHCKVSHKS